MTAATVLFPYRFWIHAFFCLTWGLVRIADGELTTPLLLYIFGCRSPTAGIETIRKNRRSRILTLNHAKFTENDVEILRKILDGKKYEAIAHEMGKTLPTLKRHISRLFDLLQVSDRVSFVSRYSGFTITHQEKST